MMTYSIPYYQVILTLLFKFKIATNAITSIPSEIGLLTNLDQLYLRKCTRGFFPKDFQTANYSNDLVCLSLLDVR